MMSASSSAVDYGALDISDVASDEINAGILRRVKDNDPDFTELWVTGEGDRDVYDEFDRSHTYSYLFDGRRSMGVLGHYLGRSTSIRDLHVELPSDLSVGIIEPFLLGLQSNRSIGTLDLMNSRFPHDFISMLTPFMASNPNLVKMCAVECELDRVQYQSLSLALREIRSLKEYSISGLSNGGRYDHEESIIEHIEALKMHPHLESLNFVGFSLGRNACASLSGLLQQQSAGMRHLYLRDNAIDDSGVETLVDCIAQCRGLKRFQLFRNLSITARGWRAVASLLEDPVSSLETLFIGGPAVKGEISILFANALARNNTLQRLYIGGDADITSNGWTAFSRVLCDTSSVNSTFLSNHTLHCIEGAAPQDGVPDDIASLLAMNQWNDKKAVAFRKALLYHADFDMQPLFEWDLKVLPFVIQWFERAAAYEIETEEGNQKRKLAAVYQFVRGMPELSIDGISGANTKSAKMGGKKRPHPTAFEGQ